MNRSCQMNSSTILPLDQQREANERNFRFAHRGKEPYRTCLQFSSVLFAIRHVDHLILFENSSFHLYL